MGYIIDDRPYTPDPGEPDNTICIVAEKRGKNGNVKKAAALKTVGGVHTEELIERQLRENEGSCVTISIVSEPMCKIIKDEKEFLKIVRKMMK